MNFFKYLKIKTQKFLFWLSFIAFSLFLPFRTARAIPGLDILTAPFVFLAKLATAFVIAVPMSWGLLALAQVFLNWASNPALVGGITTNDFVMEGWGIVRDFSNLFFILIVVAIGIATALRIRQYEVKKTLPRLIVVAVLINFSPVICGIVIDTANILMSYFMTAGAAGFGDALNLAGSAGSFLGDSMRSALGNWSEIWRGILFVKLLFLIAFNFFAAFVLAMLGMLFIVRNLFLWILVIFSPFAFISAVLPGTKKYVYNWWSKNFLQWTFIGVAASFFIYLSQLMLHLGTKTLMGGNVPATAVTEFGGRTITNIMVLAVPFVFLVIGYSVTLSFAPMGASAVINAAKKGGKWAYGKTGGKAITALRGEARKTLRTMAEAPKGIVGKIGEKATKVRGVATEKKLNAWEAAKTTSWRHGKAKKLLSAAGRWTQEKATGGIAKHGTAIGDLGSKQMKKIEEEAKDLSVNATIARIRSTKSQAEKLAYLNRLVKNNDVDQALKSGLKASEISSTLDFAQEQHMEKDVFAALPHLAYSRIKPKGGQTRDQAFGEMLKKIKPKRSKYIAEESLDDDNTIQAIVKNWNKSHFASLLGETGTLGAEKVEKQIIKQAGTTNPKKAMKWLKGHNNSLYQYIKSNAAKGLFDKLS